jgi:hypothetical protein
MGQETRCVVRKGKRRQEGKALLETNEIIFRTAELTLKIPFKSMNSVKSANGELRIGTSKDVVIFELGAQADKWAQKILHPKTRIEKLGVKPGANVAILGGFDEEFLGELSKVAGSPSMEKLAGQLEWIFLSTSTLKELARTTAIAQAMKDAAVLWIVYPKGKKEITQNDVISAGRSAGLKDVKVVGFSPTHTALKFVIPLEKR